ncbi:MULTISPECIES: ABC transporter substrate-binding protein [unclassified Salinibacterium]|uniref:ABC transporter substrate-binding protein n=1 Tax=unclassified Salinibacterium TaxID=2632331 RepID=UPI00143DF5BA|nr:MULTISPECIES: ABC transporter substrate-binding protein [unclassified Salinibacterium]
MTKNRLLRSLPAAALLGTLFLSGCSGVPGQAEASEPSGVLRVNWGGLPENWAPGHQTEAGYIRVPYETLTSRNRDGAVVPMLATEWEQSDTELTLTLREGVTFHDGEPLTADAVKANLEAIQAAPLGGPLLGVSAIDAVDELTVRLTLSAPNSSLLTTLSTVIAPIVSPASLEDGSIAEVPVGTGPWAYDAEASVPGKKMSFTVFDDYWGASVGYETIELVGLGDDAAAAALIAGTLDVSDAEPEMLTRFADTPVRTMQYPASRTSLMFFDRGPGGVFESRELRQAVCHAINVDAVNELEGAGTSATQYFTEGTAGHFDAPGYAHDEAAAKKLYQQAGSPELSARLVASTDNNAQVSLYMDQVAQALSGVRATVYELPPVKYNASWNTGDYGLGVGMSTSLTPYDWYRTWFAADAPGNPAGVESEALREAADLATNAGISDKADALWSDAMEIVSDEALSCAHRVESEILAWNSTTVTSVSNPVEPWEPNSINYRSLKPLG